MTRFEPKSAHRTASGSRKPHPTIDHPLAYLIPKGASSFNEIFGSQTFFAIESRLTYDDNTLSAVEIADAIEANPDSHLPPRMRQEVCRILRTAKRKKKRGPKRPIAKDLQWLIATTYYRGALRQLRLDDSGKSRGRDSARDPRYRQAAEKAIKEAGLSIEIETFLNRLSQERVKGLRRDKMAL